MTNKKEKAKKAGLWLSIVVSVLSAFGITIGQPWISVIGAAQEVLDKAEIVE